MKRLGTLGFVLLFLICGVASASALTINLVDSEIYFSGTSSSHDDFGFDVNQGLGEIVWTTTQVGTHSFAAFFDHEIDQAGNTFFNEVGNANGAVASNQTWEIDEPGFLFGDIYSHTLVGNLDNTNAVGESDPDDVSMALGWDFTLTAGQRAEISLLLSTTAPSSGFYLSQTDPDSQVSIYFSSALDITGGEEPPIPSVPEPGTCFLLGTGLIGLLGLKRKGAKRA